MSRSNPLLAWCRSYRARPAVAAIRRASLAVEPLEVRCVPANFTVSNLSDGGLGSGSLRSAIIQSNTNFQNQTNTITLNAGTYKLSIAGTFEQAAATGDLDITGTQTMIMQGAGSGLTFIDAKQIDRVFDVIGSGVTVTFRDLTITGGYLEATPTNTTLHGGGILNEGGSVTLQRVVVTGNELNGYLDTAGGGVSSDGGTLTVSNSTISANILSYIGEFTGGTNGANGASGNSSHPTGYDGTSGGAGPGGGAASGGGVFVRNATADISSSTITANTITGGYGGIGGRGGSGGQGNIPAVYSAGSIVPGDRGGNAGAGGAGGVGGDANGAGVAADGGTLTITNVQVTNNSATGGAGGLGGNGGDGGRYVGSAGSGGDAGAGGTARGAVYAGGNATLTISGSTTITGNTATGGAGGVGGRSGTPGLGYIPNAGLPGPRTSGSGGTGGLAAGAGLTIDSGTATVTDLLIQSNTTAGGTGGTGGAGSLGHDEYDFNDVDNSIEGGPGGNGGTGGSVRGAGVYLGTVTLTMTDTTIKANNATGGTGGVGGAGGNGGAGGSSTFTGGNGAVGGRGGNAGSGGNADGGGLYVTGTGGITVLATTIANNSAAAGDGGTGGNGGSGGGGGWGFFSNGSTARGGNAGNGGNAGVTAGGGVFASATGTTNRVSLYSSTVAFNTLAGGTSGKGGSGGSGSPGGTAGTAGSATVTSAILGAGVFASGRVTLANDTVAYNDTGIFVANTSVRIGNTITAQNTSLDIAGTFTTDGHNLIGIYDSTKAGGVNSTDLRGSAATPLDPKLPTILQRKGGKTDVLYPFSNSPAINAGGTPISGLTTDQRGLPRTIGSAPDIGAVEVATNYFTTNYTIPSSGAAGADVQGSVTIVIGDNAFSLAMQATQTGGGAFTAGPVPSGWTVAPYSSGYEIRANNPSPGVYTIPITLHIGSTANFGSVIGLRFVDSIGSGLSYLATPSVTVQYPVPTITSVVPISLDEGNAATLTITGTGFGIGSVVKWGSNTLATQYVNRTTLTATLPASYAESGNVSVTVVNPAPGGGTSSPFTKTVNNINPTGVVPDRYMVYPGTGTVNVTAGFISAYDPSVNDRKAGLRYSFASSIAGLAANYAAAGTTMTYTVPVSSVSTTTYYARVYDQDGGTTTYTGHVYALATNAAPSISGANNLPTINEDNVTNSGAMVSSLIAGKFSDPDTSNGQGIAVTGWTGTNGKWQWSTDGGTTWTDFGSVSDTNATLLGTASTDRVRYLPIAQDGTTATITFRAWDQSDGRTTGTTGVDVSINDGSTAYSGTAATATQIVTEVNDPPRTSTLDYTMGADGVLRIPIADVLAACSPGPAPESGQTLTLAAIRVDGAGQVPGFASVSGSDIVFRPTTGRSGFALLYYTVQDNGTTNGVLSPARTEGLIRVFVDSTPAPGAVDDTLSTITQGSPAFTVTSATLTANDRPSYGGTVTLVSVGNPVGGTVQMLDPPAFNARIEFTPDPGFVGVASFIYTITDDGTGMQSQGTVRFVIEPDNPVVATTGTAGTPRTWVDANGDGSLDGVTGSVIIAGDGAGHFATPQVLVDPSLDSVAWGDYNRDGYLDMLGVVSGPSTKPTLLVFDPNTGTYVDAGATFDLSNVIGVRGVSWADFNNDGNLDIVVSVASQIGNQFFNETVFLRNDGVGHFQYQQAASVIASSFSWADANGDGYPDLLVGTYTGPRYFQNDGTGRFAAPVNPTDHNDVAGSVVSTWGDYDSDGFPDFVSGGFNPLTGNELALYHNNGNGTFTNFGSLGPWSPGVGSDLDWADVNSDGRPDLIYTEYGHIIDVNDGGLLRPATTLDVPVLAQIENTHGAIGWGDYDNNGTLDILQEDSIVNNYGAPPTNRPTAPTNLAATPGSGNTVRLSWDAASDDNTPTAALTYTIRVGTTPGGNEIVSAPALADGTRIVSTHGAFSRTFSDVTGLTANTTYYWEVQAVDATYRGSIFASGSFSFNHAPAILGAASADTNEDTPLKLTATDFLQPVQDADVGDSIQSIRIDSLPTSGTLLYQGQAVAVGQEFAVVGTGYDPTDWLVYIPDANVSASSGPLDQFTFAASDGHSYGNSGNFDLYVNPVADTPYLNVTDQVVPNSVPFPFVIDAGTPDTDGSETVRIDIFQLPANATLSAGSFQSGAWRLTAADLPGLKMTVDTPTSTSFGVDIAVTTKEAFGGGSTPVFGHITVTVEVPTITSINVPTTVAEGTQVNLSASAIDPSGTGLTYTWDINSLLGEFQLDGANASFTPPDNGHYDVQLAVTDTRGAATTSLRYPVDVTNVDPVINTVSNDGPVAEGSPVTINVNASDVAGDYDPLLFAFDFDNNGSYESTSPTHIFMVKGTYTVPVLVDDGDGGVAFGSTTVTVTHTDPAQPVDTDSTPNSVPEGAASGTRVGITAASTQALGLPISYSLANDAGGRFVIDPNTGIVMVANGSLLDFETSASHTITVQATDGQGGSSTQDFSIAVTNAKPTTPTDSDATADSVVEGASNGTRVGITASATDVNGPAVTFSLTNDAGGRFAIDAASGVVTVANGSLLDFESATGYAITVQASDGAGDTSSADFNIAVTNANPTAPTDLDATPDMVVEGASKGTAVGITATASDPGGPPVTFSLTNDAGGRFAIDSTTGVVKVVDGNLLNYETATSYRITVQASDGHGGTSTADFTISIANVSPSAPVDIDGAANSVAEGVANGTPVGITASADDVNGPNVSFSLVDDAGGRFAIDPSTGVVKVANGTLLDYETSTSHVITVQASDGRGGTSTQDFTITVANVNPSTPTDANPAANGVLEHAPNGTPVGVTAKSSDPNGPAVAYALIDDAGGRFAINPTTGVITVANSALLDFQVAPSHTILVQASDGRGGASTQTFTITVLDARGPTVTIGAPSAAATTNGPITYTITYTDTNFQASTLSASSITLNRTGTANGTVTVDAGSGPIRTVTIKNITGSGLLSISLLANTAHDLAGNQAAAVGPSTPVIVRPGLRFDMRKSTTGTPSGWNSVLATTAYSSATGFGWLSTKGLTGVSTPVPSPLPSGVDGSVYGDAVMGTSAATFRVFVGSNQSATVRVYSYLPFLALPVYRGGSTVSVTGGGTGTVYSPLDGGAPQPYVDLAGQAGADGFLDVTVSVPTGYACWAVNGIDILPPK